MKFKEKRILVTGASSGIGREVALRIAKDQGELILSARNLEKLNVVKEEAKSFGATVSVVPADVTVVDDVRQLFLKASEGGQQIDGVFNNAGLGFIGNIWELEAEQIQKMVSVNVMGMMLVTKFASEVMTRQKSGHIFMTSSLAGLVTLPQWSVYVGSKWAITGFADSIRTELKPYNVKVTTLHPGAVKTEFFDPEKANINISAMGKFIEPAEVAEAIYLAFFTDVKKVIVPSTMKSYDWVKRHVPALNDLMMEKLAAGIEYHDKPVEEDEPQFSYIVQN